MKKLLALVLVCLFAFSLVACASPTGKLAKIESTQKMVVYTDPNFKPFEFPGEDGVFQGVDIEIAKAIAAELGATAEFKESNFDAIILAVKQGKADIAVTGMTITEKRKESIDFSVPYIKSVQYLILPEASEIAVMEDLADKAVGVAKGYTGHLWLDDEINEEDGVLFGKNTDMQIYNSAIDAALDLKGSARIDAVVMDEYVAKDIVAANAGLKAIELKYENGDLAEEEYGVALPKGNEDLLEKINQVIQKLKDEDKITEWMREFTK